MRWWAASQQPAVRRCGAEERSRRSRREEGELILLPSPEETGVSGTSPERSDGARSPQTSEKHKQNMTGLAETSSIR